VSNATDIEERVNAGFAALLERLREATRVDDPDLQAKANAAALEREQARVRAEYLHLGLEPPSPFALSITARREMGHIIERAEAAE